MNIIKRGILATSLLALLFQAACGVVPQQRKEEIKEEAPIVQTISPTKTATVTPIPTTVTLMPTATVTPIPTDPKISQRGYKPTSPNNLEPVGTNDKYPIYSIDPFNNILILSKDNYYVYIWSEEGKTWVSTNVFPDIVELYDPHFAMVEKETLTYMLSIQDMIVYKDKEGSTLSVNTLQKRETFTISDEKTKNLLQNLSLYNLLNQGEKIFDNQSVESRVFSYFISTLRTEFLYDEKNPQDILDLAKYVNAHQNFLKDKKIFEGHNIEEVNELIDVKLEIDGEIYTFEDIPIGNAIQGFAMLYFISDSFEKSAKIAKILPETIYIPDIEQILKPPNNQLEQKFIEEFLKSKITEICGFDAYYLKKLITIYERKEYLDEKKCGINTIGRLVFDFLEKTDLYDLGKPPCKNGDCLSYKEIN